MKTLFLSAAVINGVNTPYPEARFESYSVTMKHKNSPQDQQPKSAGAIRSNTTQALAQNETKLKPSAEEVSRRAYFRYLNEGSPAGRDVQHWLEAEAYLMAEISRIHGSDN
jgi:hypothetical protein